jgi:fucokinase
MAAQTHAEYLSRIVDGCGVWWDAIVVTAGDERQAERYRMEIARREAEGRLPRGARFVVVADREGRRAGSGGATIEALGALEKGYWERHRVLVIHGGGEARRLPQHAAEGRLFGVLAGDGGERTSVFDRTMEESAGWVERMGPGVLVMPGDVVVEFDAAEADWSREGVTGLALKLPAEVGEQHGVYVADGAGRVYTVLQKPERAAVAAAGGLMEDGRVAVDTGLLRLDAETAGRLAELAEFQSVPEMDLYGEVVQALTGQWRASGGLFWRALEGALRGTGFHVNVLEGRFQHVGTTRSFRKAAAGIVLDSVLGEGSEVGVEAAVVECCLPEGLKVGRGAVAHGLRGLAKRVEVPEETVVHQVEVQGEDGRRGTVIRVYGVEDDAQAALWFGRPVGEVLGELGIAEGEVWGEGERSLWTARLFPVGTAEEAWGFAEWMMGRNGAGLREEWRKKERYSLESSGRLADAVGLAEARGERARAQWQRSAVALAKAGADLRPMLEQAAGLAAVVTVARALEAEAEGLGANSPAEAASRAMQAGRCWRKVGMREEAEAAEERAMGWVGEAVERGVAGLGGRVSGGSGFRGWAREGVRVTAPARIDLGGGWSDTPPFCQDWGGTVLNVAVEIGGGNPIGCTVERLSERVVRCVSEETGERVEWRWGEELRARPKPGTVAAIPLAALQVTGLAERWEEMEGGLEIRLGVRLPVGSGLGTSSILAAAVVRALGEMAGFRMGQVELSDAVMRLEQRMTTGGGWQDQAGGIYPGAKLLTTGPGLEQRIRVRGVEWTEARRAEFAERLVVCDTGIQRMAKNLLRQVVGSYLAREADTVQVLHSIKTLAGEMAYAMAEGEWGYLGQLLDRHWRLNVRMDPHTTNGPIEGLLDELRPWVAGAKLAGAGGGGFLLLLGKGPEEAAAMRKALGARAVEWRISETGMRVEE